MNRFNLSEKQKEILAYAFMGIVVSTVLFVLSLLLILFWNGLNYLLDYDATVDYVVLWYVYAVCWIASLVISPTFNGTKQAQPTKVRRVFDEGDDIWQPQTM